MRGNRTVVPRTSRHVGSIPARAGKPAPARAWLACCEVYPRACGETGQVVDEILTSRGLSPRMRGNRMHDTMFPNRDGSIPARAGKPRAAPTPRSCRQVYPRACGETRPALRSFVFATGLSPRVRGNLNPDRHIALDLGSIPARAGEPPGSRPARRSRRVYPRACGGTAFSRNAIRPSMGLSPRVRGNPFRRQGAGGERGSIPARAGEPLAWGNACPPTWVYPRACGGTSSDAA